MTLLKNPQVLIYRHRSAVAVFPGLLEAVAAHCRLDHVYGLWFIEETFRVTCVQERHKIGHAAAAEEFWDFVATKQKVQAMTCEIIILNIWSNTSYN